MKASKLTRETIRHLGVSERKHPAFGVGDTIAVARRIKEGDKERTQIFEGDVVAIHNHGASSTFTVRKIGANAVPVELILPYSCPAIESIAFVRKGDVRRAKLYYMRKRVGRASRVREMVMTREEKEQERAQV